jgi:hypothetical protein
MLVMSSLIRVNMQNLRVRYPDFIGMF